MEITATPQKITLDEIREDLKQIRFYYAHKDLFTNDFKENSVIEKVRKYNQVVNTAPARLLALYISLYANNATQEAVAHDMGYSTRYIQMQHKKLLEYLQSKL